MSHLDSFRLSSLLNSSGLSNSHKSSEPDDLAVSVITDGGIFNARLEDVTTMSRVLQELHHSDEHSVLVVSSDGIRLVTAEKTFQVSAYFSKNCFQDFIFRPPVDKRGKVVDQVTFRFMKRDFIECLGLLDDQLNTTDGDRSMDESNYNQMQKDPQFKTTLHCQYHSEGEPLRLELRNGSDYLINCEVMAFSINNNNLFSPLRFSNSDEPATILLKSRTFREYFSGLDLTSSDFIMLTLKRGEIALKLSINSLMLGELELEIAEKDKMVKQLKISQNVEYSFRYKTQFIRPALDSLKSSSLVQLRCSSNGLLCIEHFHAIDKRIAIVELAGPGGMHIESQNSRDILSQFNQPQNKRSSVEYFILCEALPAEFVSPC